MIHDVVVVGAGPAGAAATLTARRLAPAASIAVVEREAFPRDKPCGDAISPDAVAELAKLGLARAVDGYAAVEQLRLKSPSGHEVADAPPAAGYVIPRSVFDRRLADEARAAATTWLRATAREVHVTRADARVRAQAGSDGDAELRGRVVIGADGANSVVRRVMPDHAIAPRQMGVAVRAYAPAPAGPPEMLLIWEHAAALAYAWSFPIDAQRCNVGYGVFGAATPTPRSQLLRRLEALLPHGAAADPASIRGHRLPLSGGGLRLGHGPVLLAGDAASLINPITGEGIYYALLSGRLAAMAALRSPEAPLRAYRATLRAAIGSHLRSTRWLAGVTRGGQVLDLLVRSAAASPATSDLLADLAFGKGALTPMTAGTIASGVWRATRPAVLAAGGRR